jgi:hypothetical protein
MATTTNYGWTTPNDSDPFKDGALAIRTLGQSVDTSLFSITGGKNVGAVFISGQSVVNAATITFNTIFNSTFQDYFITISGANSVASAQFAYRNATGATPTSNNQYDAIEVYSTQATAPSNYAGGFSDRMHVADGGTATTSGVIYVFDPFLAIQTRIQASSSGFSSAGQFSNLILGAGFHNDSTSYNGFVLTTNTGTFTGDIRVYGLRSA